MCKHRNSRKVWIDHQERYAKIDRCICHLIASLNEIGVKTLASCCGHGRYPMSIIVLRKDGERMDLCSGWTLRNTRNFYKKDADGFYRLTSLPPNPKGSGIREEIL